MTGVPPGPALKQKLRFERSSPDTARRSLFVCPNGASMKLVSGTQIVQVTSSAAPLGRAMLDKCEGDEVSIQLAST